MTDDVSRRGFVAGAALAAAAVLPLAAQAADTPAPAATATPAASAAEGTVPFAFDRTAFMAVLNRPFDHRQVYTATSFAKGIEAMQLMRNSIEAYVDPRYFAGGENAMHAACVLYHGSSAMLALDDAMFATYPLAAAIVQFDAVKPGIDKDAKKNSGADAYKRIVAEHGATFIVCNNALSGIAGYIAKQIQPAGVTLTRDRVVAIHDEFVAHFLPGTVLAPAGVAAINAAQEARYTLLVV